MGKLLFSPNGRIGSSEFIKAGFILILVSIAFNLIKISSSGFDAVLGFLSFVMMYPWVVIWIKRLRTGNKSGWMVLLYILIYIIIMMVSIAIVLFMFGGSQFIDLINAQMAGDISQTEYMTQVEALGRELALPTTIATVLSSLLTLFIGDKTIPNTVDTTFD